MYEIKGPFARHVRSVVALLAVVTLTAACSGAPTASPTAKPAEAAKPAPTAAADAAKPGEAAKPAQPAKPAADAAKPAAGVDFAGKTVRLIVGYPPGGGFDSTARLIAPVLQQTIPGSPTIVVENMPGADSLIAAKTVLSGPVRPDEVNIVVYISTLTAKSFLAGGLDGFAVEK